MYVLHVNLTSAFCKQMNSAKVKQMNSAKVKQTCVGLRGSVPQTLNLTVVVAAGK